VCMQVQWANIFLLKVLHDVDQEEEDVDRFETMFTWTSRITLQTLRNNKSSYLVHCMRVVQKVSYNLSI
jgi:hypothetical protein